MQNTSPKYFKALRKILRLSQGALAVKLGVSALTIGNLERGDEIPLLYALAIERLSLTIADFENAPMLAAASVRGEALRVSAMLRGHSPEQ